MLALRATVSVTLLAIVVAVIGHFYGLNELLDNANQLSIPVVGLIASGLIANALMAALRFKIIASGTGHSVKFRQAMAVVGAGSLGGALFFQIAGQLMARGVLMKRVGVPFASVVVITLYERFVAALVSGLIAVFGAFYIFGKVYLDQSANGADLIKIVVGLVAAIGCAAWLGFGRDAITNFKPLLTWQVIMRLLRIAGLTLLVQAPMMMSYVVIVHAFSPKISIVELVAASAIVMFAASVPISLAGWGVRELSAVAALGVIGVAASDALTAAIMIGAGSLLAMATIMLFSFQFLKSKEFPTETNEVALFDYGQALSWVLPVAAAVCVLFQVYVPVRAGLLNVNLADPIAILAGTLFVMKAVSSHRWPEWRVNYINLSVVIATLVLGGSLLLGASRFGWTDWALVNRFFGWFVLLAFAATGALIVSEGGERAFRIFVLTYVGATAGVMMLEVLLTYLVVAGVPLSSKIVRFGDLGGFAQNHNFFAFQILIFAAGALVMLRNSYLRILLWALMLLALWYAGSRSGWIAIVCVLAAGMYLRVASFREVVIGAILAVALTLVPALVQGIHILAPNLSGFGVGEPNIAPDIVPSGISTGERIRTLVGGWALFLDHPFFGAGLGAYRHQMNIAASGIPLVIHSTALWLMAELGLVGFFAFAVPGIYIWATEWRRASRERASAVVALCFVSFAVMSGPADMVYQRTFWLMVGAALAVPRLNAGKSLTMESPNPSFD